MLGGAAAAAVAAEVVEVAAVVADSEVVVVVSEVADSEVVAEVSVVATAMAVATAMVATAAISAIAGADTFARTIERSVGPIRNQNEKGASIIRRTFFVNCPRASYIDAPLQRGGSLVARESVELVSGDDKNAARVLADLAKVGVKRILPAWFSADPPAYPKSIGSTKLEMPAWDDDAEDRKKAAALYKEPATDLEALREIIRALPIQVGDMRWRT